MIFSKNQKACRGSPTGGRKFFIAKGHNYVVDMSCVKKLIQFLEGSWNHEYFGSLAK